MKQIIFDRYLIKQLITNNYDLCRFLKEEEISELYKKVLNNTNLNLGTVYKINHYLIEEDGKL